MVYKWYILPIGGLYATYHLLREPETAIDTTPIRIPCSMGMVSEASWEAGPTFFWATAETP